MGTGWADAKSGVAEYLAEERSCCVCLGGEWPAGRLKPLKICRRATVGGHVPCETVARLARRQAQAAKVAVGGVPEEAVVAEGVVY